MWSTNNEHLFFFAKLINFLHSNDDSESGFSTNTCLLFLRDSYLEVLLHGYACSPDSHHNFNDLKMEINDFFDSEVVIKNIATNQYIKLHEHKVHHGALSIKRSIFKRIEWTNKIKGQDVQFIEMCLSQGIKISAIDNVLYYYRNDFSSKAENLNNKNYLKKILKKLKL